MVWRAMTTKDLKRGYIKKENEVCIFFFSKFLSLYCLSTNVEDEIYVTISILRSYHFCYLYMLIMFSFLYLSAWKSVISDILNYSPFSGIFTMWTNTRKDIYLYT